MEERQGTHYGKEVHRQMRVAICSFHQDKVAGGVEHSPVNEHASRNPDAYGEEI